MPSNTTNLIWGISAVRDFMYMYMSVVHDSGGACNSLVPRLRGKEGKKELGIY